MKINWKKIIFALVLVAFAAIGRYLLQPLGMPNLETMTVSALLAGAVLGGWYALAVPLAAVAVFDLFYGNSPILLFTWSAWAIIGVFGLVLNGRLKTGWKFAAGLTGLGLFASLFFFFWTNFGVWLMWGYYPKTAAGLVACFVAGIPFIKTQMMGNLVVVPIVSTAFYFLWKKIGNKEFSLEKMGKGSLLEGKEKIKG